MDSIRAPWYAYLVVAPGVYVGSILISNRVIARILSDL